MADAKDSSQREIFEFVTSNWSSFFLLLYKSSSEFFFFIKKIVNFKVLC